MAHLDEYVVPAKQLPRSAFCSEHPHPVLLLYLRADNDGQRWTFKTETVSSARVNLVKWLDAAGLKLSPDALRYEVFDVVKTKGNPWKDHISIGRARNNDVVLLDSSVSKMHAHISHDGKGVYHLIDMGSLNGTMLEHRPLAPNQPARLFSGTTITVGRLELVFLDAGALYDFINNCIVQT